MKSAFVRNFRYQKDIAFGHHLSPLKKRIRENITPRRGDEIRTGSIQNEASLAGNEACTPINISGNGVSPLGERCQIQSEVVEHKPCTEKEQVSGKVVGRTVG